jgi:hypothetical protein
LDWERTRRERMEGKKGEGSQEEGGGRGRTSYIRNTRVDPMLGARTSRRGREPAK